ncbi:MAG: outer membrane protein assembly factor BamA [Acidobacteria bacterium]|nr:outer membrane protein assembly factor BamA [Acidobacteriota bacterium]
MAKSAITGICIIGFLLAGPVAFAQQSQSVKIERIDIRGNRRIPEERIRFYIQSFPGDAFDEASLEFDLRALWKSNFFDDIQIHERDGDVGKIITFIVEEKPVIRSIEFIGNSAFSESDILDEFKEMKVGLSIDSRYAPSKIKSAERILKRLLIQYGKPLGTVRSEIEDIPPSSVKVRFVMEEGPTVQIGQIRFAGNKIFSDDELKNALELNKEHGISTMFKGTDKYHPEKLDMDIALNLEKFYKAHGYMQVQVGKPVVRILQGPRGLIPFIRKSKQQFYIEIPVDAGDQYRIGNLELANCEPLNCEGLKAFFGLKEGDTVNFTMIQNTLEGFKKLYADMGYINWSYIPEQSFDPEKLTYNLKFDFDTGKRFQVQRIDFTGNTKTRDKVIRRELLLEEGHFFSSTLLERSILKLNQLGFFDTIEEKDYEVLPDERQGTVDVNINVVEQSQQSIGFTGGVSGISGSFIGINYSTNNFMGRGESLEFAFTGGTRTTTYIVSFTEPYLFDTTWSMGVSVYNRRYRYDTYSAFGLTDLSTGDPLELFTQRTTGTTLTFNKRIARSLWSAGMRYSFQRISITSIAEGFETYALGQFVGLANNPRAALEGITRSEITPMLSYNSTNAYFNPSRGTSLYVSAGLSGGILGGDFSMLHPMVEYRHFFPDRWLSGGRNVFGFHLMGEYIQSFGDSSIPFYERFFIGGENTIRGFDIRSISPLAVLSTPQYDQYGNPIIDPQTGLPQAIPNLIPVGGDTMGVFNFEYRIPIAGPLSVAAFYDMGMARVSRKESLGEFGASTVEVVGSANNAIRSSTGVEVQFVLPVVSAPFRLIFAYNPQRLDQTINVGNRPYRLREPSSDIKFTVGRSF